MRVLNNAQGYPFLQGPAAAVCDRHGGGSRGYGGPLYLEAVSEDGGHFPVVRQVWLDCVYAGCDVDGDRHGLGAVRHVVPWRAVEPAAVLRSGSRDSGCARPIFCAGGRPERSEQ